MKFSDIQVGYLFVQNEIPEKERKLLIKIKDDENELNSLCLYSNEFRKIRNNESVQRIVSSYMTGESHVGMVTQWIKFNRDEIIGKEIDQMRKELDAFPLSIFYKVKYGISYEHLGCTNEHSDDDYAILIEPIFFYDESSYRRNYRSFSTPKQVEEYLTSFDDGFEYCKKGGKKLILDPKEMKLIEP